ncbi:MAG: hypothetical protein KKD21_06975 [Proteobacteria bacterium]|nr:hypothetical protein [Pseudomonadota bacterium]MBU1696774.1 hypothetical protein [Pseudomonadota bacterium]
MFNKRVFGDMRRAGMGIGVSKSKLSTAMQSILEQLPVGTTNLKDNVVHNLGLIGQMSSSRDINEAWNTAKKKTAKENPGKFILNSRGVINWNDGTIKVLDTKISKANFEKLNELAENENCTVNKMVSNLIRTYQKQKA